MAEESKIVSDERFLKQWSRRDRECRGTLCEKVLIIQNRAQAVSLNQGTKQIKGFGKEVEEQTLHLITRIGSSHYPPLPSKRSHCALAQEMGLLDDVFM